MRFPKELSATKKLRPLTALLLPKTFSRNKLAATCFAAARSTFGTVEMFTVRQALVLGDDKNGVEVTHQLRSMQR